MSRELPKPPIGWIDPRTTERYGTRYCARYREGGKVVTLDRFESYELAYDALVKVHKARRRGLNHTDGTMTLREYVTDVWLPLKRPPAVEIDTYRDYEGKLRNHILPRLGDVPLDKLHHSMIQTAINDVAAVGTLANARAVLRPLKMVTKAALIDRHIDYDPGQAVKVKKGEPDQEKWTVIQPDRIGSFFAALDELEECWRLLLLLEMELGARLGEMRGLRRRDIDFDACEVTIDHAISETEKRVLDQIDEWDRWPKGQYRIDATFFYKPTKTNRVRVVPIDHGVAGLLKDYVERHELLPDGLLFPSPEGGPLGGSYFRRAVWHPFLRQAGLPPMRLHDLRHTVASYLLDSGELSWQEVMSIMGWTTVAMVQRYTHLLSRPDRKTVSIRNKAYGLPERRLRAV